MTNLMQFVALEMNVWREAGEGYLTKKGQPPLGKNSGAFGKNVK
jgi:hypothetical protein